MQTKAITYEWSANLIQRCARYTRNRKSFFCCRNIWFYFLCFHLNLQLNSVIGIQNRQSQKLRNCSIQINELNAQVIDLRRRLEETTSSKKSLEQIASVVNDPTASSSRNIKPRTAKIILKRVAESSIESLLAKKSKYWSQHIFFLIYIFCNGVEHKMWI